MTKIMKIFKNRMFQAAVGMTVGTILYCAAIVFILDLGNFYAGGLTGVAQIFETIYLKYISSANAEGVAGLKSLVISLLNLPLFIIGWKGVSKRFAILSLASVLIQVVFIALFEYIRIDLGINPVASMASNPLMLCILGGLVLGVSLGLPLRYGASTGGMDIISQYFSFKKKASFAKVSFSIDLLVILAAGVVGSIEIAAYTIIRLIVSILVLDKVHTIYKFVKISIVTEERGRMREELIACFNHGITIYAVTGGYSNSPKYVFESIVSTYEIEDYKSAAKRIDPECFITYTAIKGIDGFFNQNTIA